MIRPWTTERKILAGFTAALAVLCIVAAVSVLSTLDLLRICHDIAHGHQISDRVNHLQGATIQLASDARAYAAAPSDAAFNDWRKTRKAVSDDEDAINALSTDVTLRSHVAHFHEEMAKRIDPTVPGADPKMLVELWKPGVLKEAIHTLLVIQDEGQNDLLARDHLAASTAYETFVTIGLASVLAVVLVCGAAAIILRDLKKRKLAETAAHEARLAADTANMAKSAFLANISHEVRTPLTAILGYADLLMAPTVDERERQRYLLTMRRSGEHLLTIINDVLDLSKIEAGRMQLEIIDCRLVEILADVDSLMRPRAATKGITFSLEYASPVPDRIMTDPTRLRQVLVNLAGNAVKFTEHGSVRVTIRYQAPAQESSRALLSIEVTDTGIGISEAQQKALFEPFTQADVSTTRRYGGTGLGLSISRRLSQLMEGDLRVQSELQRGSTFRMSLPIVPVAEAAMLNSGEVQEVLALARSSDSSARKISARVLLAEDGPENREVISLHLQRAGCDVITADDGQEAVDLALAAVETNRPFDVILMDMQMPVMDGYTATATLRAKNYRGAIIALTANAMTEDRDRCLHAGCDEYAGKPVDIPVLVQMIEQATGKSTATAPASPASAAPPILKTLMHDPVLLSLTRKFGESTVNSVSALTQMLARHAITELAESAHKLAGAGGSYGFNAITLEAKQLERLARSNGTDAELTAQLARVDQACLTARAAIDQAAALGQVG